MDLNDFESARPRLLAVATRMLGSPADAEDAVQEAWLRADRADGDGTVDNPTAWLTTVVSRICLDRLRARRETTPLDDVDPADTASSPADEAQLAEAVGAAMGAVLDDLAPAERVAFVLHDVFAVPFDDVASVLGKSPAATRQLASRARRRVAGTPRPDAARTDAVRAFLAASRDGDFTALVELLDPDAVFRTHADGAPSTVLAGAPAIAEAFLFKAKTALVALVDGVLGYTVRLPGAPGYLLLGDVTFTADGRIAALNVTLRADEVAGSEVVVL
ncbi:sigma-70 family RNA polymerase sigma factor [Tsukamurella ocularis]|uniref:sigma-70 family RNA polymerase sigma factor n=1 Tax=Tsukamurella ocularis TaxID=1970234 RepID=UPI00216A06B5|nr:sigma-70 family RNA polymerase sigma factor [Tsukamurella ocularis]MCS3780116.1 RNA polymerase sigma-70 factor (ECF subfamily) [Tsukamurella ocularis]MCS3786330.1 RNA polymerase sigma-70 factor (ECF subfamily) [Tsukamurella ocularis]MCS3849694.1 RNA polymerase sigma-70 factor (ECF subfamily) [Tsukamurella ocularis]